ncbi:single-stranded DNA-binding protein [Nitratifractor sp.]
MYNRVILVGNLTRDVEIRYTPSGTAIGKVGIATNRRFKTANGEQRDETMFIDLTFFGRTAEIANQYLRKGSKVLVEGRLVLEQWTAQDGSKRSKHSVTVDNLQMLDRPGENSGAGGSYGGGDRSYGSPAPRQQAPQYSDAAQSPAPSAAPKAPAEPSVPEIDIDEEEIPF